ncbi:Tn3 family transposase [Streptomyces sp. NPDC008122]|uniref:Tn3 family transposase n=1 Tax=Streptomyces sp. NPDC008122 TaxID=3364810 RepID=UPI0036EA18E1
MEDQPDTRRPALKAVVLWNSFYLDRAAGQLAVDGFPVSDDLLARLSPPQFDHINFYPDDFRVGGGLLVEASRPQHAGDQAPVGVVGNGLSSVDEVAVHVVGPGTECFEVVIQ